MNIFERIKQIGLPFGQYAVFGSALLEVWGIRKAADLDIIALPGLYEWLRKEGLEEKYEDGITWFKKGEADITTIQFKPTTGSYLPDRVKLIKEAAIINGCPFVRIEEVIACKRDYNREKDQKDVVNILEYLKQCGERDPYNYLFSREKMLG